MYMLAKSVSCYICWFTIIYEPVFPYDRQAAHWGTGRCWRAAKWLPACRANIVSSASAKWVGYKVLAIKAGDVRYYNGLSIPFFCLDWCLFDGFVIRFFHCYVYLLLSIQHAKIQLYFQSWKLFLPFWWFFSLGDTLHLVLILRCKKIGIPLMSNAGSIFWGWKKSVDFHCFWWVGLPRRL